MKNQSKNKVQLALKTIQSHIDELNTKLSLIEEPTDYRETEWGELTTELEALKSVMKLFEPDIENQVYQPQALYWVCFMVQDKADKAPWVSALEDACTSIDEAFIAVQKGRDNLRVLSAWIDTFDKDNNKTVVFHECYIDSLGQLKNDSNKRKNCCNN